MNRFALTLAIPLLATFAAADTINVEVRNNFYVVISSVPGQGTNTATINVGDTVVWTWIGNFHSVTETNGLFDSLVHNAPFTFQFTFTNAGTYNYMCTVHGPHMSGQIIVAGAPAPPTDIVLTGGSVPENSANGTVCGSFSTVDPDQADGHTYTLVDDAGGRFTVVGAELHVANGALLDFEQNPSHAIRVRTTDATSLFFEKDFTVTVQNVTCAEDLNGDGIVDISDLALLLSNFGRSDSPGPGDGDIDGSGTIDLTDLAMLLSAFGQSC
jgi:plastocyanin